MNALNDSLDGQHAQLDRQLERVAALGRAARWTEYRAQLAALAEGLARHMAFEEEALFPALEKTASAAVRELREQHARLRRQLEMLGAAAPERDPDGCLAEIDDLAARMREHHAAEMALDPQYATRPIPALVFDAAPAIDLRGLQPPEPIVRIFQALDRGEAPLRVVLPHEPVPLYALLKERGYSWSGAVRADGGYELVIER